MDNIKPRPAKPRARFSNGMWNVTSACGRLTASSQQLPTAINSFVQVRQVQQAYLDIAARGVRQ